MSSNSSSNIQLTRISERLDDVKETVIQTIDNIMERGEKLEVLVDKTDNLESTAFEFHRSSQNLRRKMLCKKIKLYSAGVFSITFFCWFISSMICGFDYKTCQ